MNKQIEVEGYTEDLKLRVNGAPYELCSPSGGKIGTVYLRRGGLSDWLRAVDDARDEVLGSYVNTNFIDYDLQEQINAKAVSNFLVVKLEDFVDANGEPVPSSRSNIAAIFENPANYSLCLEVMEVAFSQELFLKAQVERDADKLKKF